jgi:WD40 repeat protein
MPLPSDRTEFSLETHPDPTTKPMRPAARVPQPPVPRKRRTHWPAVIVMIATGVLIAVGARFVRAPNRVVDGPDTPKPTPAAPTENANRTATTGVPAVQGVETSSEKLVLGVAKKGGLAGTPANARSRGGSDSVALDRPAKFAQKEMLYRLNRDRFQACAFSARGARAIVLSEGSLDIYNLVQREGKSEGPGPLELLNSQLTDPQRRPTAVAVSDDGRHAYLTTALVSDTERDGKPRGKLFNAVIHHEYQQTPELLFGPALDSSGKTQYQCVAVAPDGGVLAAGTLRPAVASWWNGAVKPPPRREIEHLLGDGVSALAFSADGKRVLFGGRERDLVLRTLGILDNSPPLRLQGHAKGVRCAAFSADGRFAISGGSDGKVCIWDFTGPAPPGGYLRPAKEIAWHDGDVYSVAFALSDDRFLTGGEDGFFCLGEVSRSQQLLRERADDSSSRVHAVGFSPDGKYALYATERSIGRCLLQTPPLGDARSGGANADALAKPLSIR